jgi:hypothetical protein
MHSFGKTSAETAFQAIFSDLLQEQRRKPLTIIEKNKLSFFEQYRRNA